MGNVASESGSSSTEFHASCGESAANRPAIVAGASENNSRTIRKSSTAAKLSKRICMNWIAAFELPKIARTSAMRMEYPGGWPRLFKSANDEDELKNPPYAFLSQKFGNTLIIAGD